MTYINVLSTLVSVAFLGSGIAKLAYVPKVIEQLTNARYPAIVPIGMRIPHITDVFRSLHAGEIGHFTLGLLSAGVPKQSRNTERLRRFHGFSPTGPVLGPKFEDGTRSVAATSVLCSATLTLDLLGPDSNLAGSVRARTWIRSCLLSLSHRARRSRAR